MVKIIIVYMNRERVRMDEDTDLKSAGCKRLGGSIPFLSAKSWDTNPRFFFWKITQVGEGGSLLNC